MFSYSVSPGIRFNDCMFTEPVRFADWVPPGCGGIVALLSHDPKWAPKPFRAVHFAEFGNNAGRDLATPPGNDPLFVAVLPMPFSTTAQRRAICDELVAAYNPAGPVVVRAPRPIGFAPQPVPATAAGS